MFDAFVWGGKRVAAMRKKKEKRERKKIKKGPKVSERDGPVDTELRGHN